LSFLAKPVGRDVVAAAFDELRAFVEDRRARVLVVDHDAKRRAATIELVAADDVEVVGAESREEAIERLLAEGVECVVVELSLPRGSGLSLIETIHEMEARRRPPVLVSMGGVEPSEHEREVLSRLAGSGIVKLVRSPE